VEKLIEQLALQSPGLAVTLVIVIFFLRHLQKTGEARDTIYQEMHKEHLDAREQSRVALRDNTAAAKENTQALSRLISAVDQIK
jgi:hypothetical protein